MSIFDITNAIARMEDSTWNPDTQSYSAVNPNSLAQKNNNPGNLRWNPLHPEYTPGAVGAGAGGFAKYTSIEDGLTDLERQVNIDANRGLNLDQFINKYAPSSENKTSIYLSNVMDWLGLTTSKVKLSSIIGGFGGGADNTDETTDVFGDDTETGSVNVGVIILTAIVGLGLWAAFKN